MIIEKDGKKYKLIEVIEPTKTMIIDGIEIETEIHHKGKTYAECEADCPDGWAIATYEILQKLRNSEHAEALHLINTWEFVQQPDAICKKNGYVAWFNADSGWADLNCDRDLTYANGALGVRYFRKVKKK